MSGNAMMSDRDLSRFESMREHLHHFDIHRTGLGALASNLLDLRDALDDIDPDWEYAFTQAVATLDSADQTAPEQRAALGDRFARIVDEAVGQLDSLVTEAIANRQPGAAGEEF
jgi:hypothetical protein